MAQIQFGSSSPTPSPRPQPQQSSMKRDFAPIPEDEIVTVEVVSVKIEDLPEWKREKSKDTHQVSFRFKVIDGQFKNRNLWGNVSPWFDSHPKCRLRLWVQEILGVDRLPDGYVFDTDDFTGLQARILVGNFTKRDGAVKDFVKDVLRAPASKNYSDTEEIF